MDTNRSYILLLIDIRKSTDIRSQDRKDAFNRLLKRLPELNRRKPKPVIGLSLNYGDEVSGLYKERFGLYELISEIRDVLYPAAYMRYVAALGKIGRVTDDITQAGGEVFKRANQMMDKLKKSNGFCRWETGLGLTDEVLTSLSELTNVLVEDMTGYQRNVYGLLQKGHSQKEIASILKKHQQSVSEAVRRGKADRVIDGETMIHRLLKSHSHA